MKTNAPCITIRGRLHVFHRPELMGIVNLTPDSFFAGSRGRADFSADVFLLDVGACSTRPGSQRIEEAEELRRLHAGMPALKQQFPTTLFSVDTFRPAVAQRVLEQYGVDMINDVSGGSEAMHRLIAETGAAYVLTYPEAGDSAEMLHWFSRQLDVLGRLGACNLLLDPGFGFAKTRQQDFDIARNLHCLHTFGLPIVAGVSRKRMVQESLQVAAEEALIGTVALETLLLEQGVHLLRAHDETATLQTIAIHDRWHHAKDLFA